MQETRLSDYVEPATIINVCVRFDLDINYSSGIYGRARDELRPEFLITPG